MDPSVTYQFDCPKQPLKVSKPKPLKFNCLMDPRAPNGRKKYAQGFVRRPTSYVIGDDLQVSPLELTFMLYIMKEFNLPFDNILVVILSIGEVEVIKLSFLPSFFFF